VVYCSRLGAFAWAWAALLLGVVGGIIVKRSLVCVVALAGCVTAAQAADLDAGGLKDPVPDNLTFKGVTIYGTIDVGYAYQDNGRPISSTGKLEYVPFTTSRNLNGQSISSINANGLEQSKIGVKIEEGIGYGWTALGRIDTAFNPLTGDLYDGCGAIKENAGRPSTQQSANSDSGRCGQMFNGVAYGGISNSAYGTLTAGRQDSLQLEAIRSYDPMSLSYAFSLLGYSGTNGGSGSTQASIWDNSAKYLYTYGPVHAGVMFSNGGQDTGTRGTDYGFNAGVTYRGFSVDAVYTKEHGAINLKSANSDAVNTLNASISDNEAWSVMGKYTYEFGGYGGYKDSGRGDKLTLFAGYTHINQSNPNSPAGAGTTTNGGYLVVPDNDAFTTDKKLDFYWTGAKYAFPSGWSFTGAYYHVDQNSYKAGGKSCADVGLGSAGATQCAGSFDQASFLVDYQFNKHFDIYAGINYGRSSDGLAAQYPGTPGANGGAPKGTATSVEVTDVVTGMRLKF
jgi:predicted porin